MAILDKNHGLTPFCSLERRLFVLEYRKRYFPGLYCQKKKLGKMAILDKNHGLTTMEKRQFFDFFKLLVFIA